MDGFASEEVQKIAFLIFKSLTLRQKYGIKLWFNTVFFIFEVIFRTCFGIHIFAIAVCPLFLPLSGDGGVDEAFHALGTFALHAVGHMTVSIWCKSSRMMPKVLLYGLGIVAGLRKEGIVAYLGNKQPPAFSNQ